MQDTIAAAREIDCGFAPHREQGGKGRKPGRMHFLLHYACDYHRSLSQTFLNGNISTKTVIQLKL
jgi:hypothetical protein